MTIKLSLENLSAIAATATVPLYDRSQLSAGIVHFGVGNFHRAHQAIYLDDLFNTGKDHDWAIVGAGVLPSDEAMRATLESQDFLTAVIEQDNICSSARVTGAMLGYVQPGDNEAIVSRLADPSIRIVSLTITEGGYFLDAATGEVDISHPAISADAANPHKPKTVFGLVVAGLRARRARGIAPFTVMSCDNIPGNGKVTHSAVSGLARLVDPDLAQWIDDNVAFPNSMVDRITPTTSPREVGIVADDYDIDDNWPVFCEKFKQWVLEDHFPAGRPALETVGVEFVPDVAPYEHMKIRILNGGHAAIAYPAALMDIHFVHEAMEEPLIRDFLAKLERDEIIPIIPAVPNTDLSEYYNRIESRFLNPKIADTIPRLAQDGSNRQPKFILPTVADRLKLGYDVTGLALVSACWCKYLCGTSDSGKQMAVQDTMLTRLRDVAIDAKDRPESFLDLSEVFGDVGMSDVFRQRFTSALRHLWTFGTRSALKAYADNALGG
ncbi:mannitol dehydrogenase family protein [Pararhizobium sp. PWRC1-1]|uniref:mannitol dehydrogenase family protein n=1 Tax=Pararhizobium sp. PWRC1-1 TaxID=2804566 RepID=UPI003CF0B768